MKVHAVVTGYGPHAFGVASPQLPALFAGSTRSQDYSGQELAELFASAGAPEEYDLVQHRQVFYSNDDHEWFVRVCGDSNRERRARRTETLAMFRELLNATLEPVQKAAKGVLGEALFIIALPDDTVGWLGDQLENDDVATLVVRAGANKLWLSDLSKKPGPNRSQLSDGTTVDELMKAHPGKQAGPTPDFLAGANAAQVSRSGELVAV